ncbi:MAG TPA: hypothetical protein VI583_04440 [Cyclobacteriaceae bacterium]|nr:hypothetical protein [Cyclobacteriaceae bacterium]
MQKKILFVFFLLSCFRAYPQGCSDAGFCSMGAMRPDQPFDRKIVLRLRSIELSIYRGKTTLTPLIYSVTADLNFSLNSRNSFQVKIPYQAVEGRLANTSGISDISVSYTRNLLSSEKFDLGISIGTKLAVNDANLLWENKPLPMYYQTSLGTYDFIAGISFLSRKWLLATGIQHPLIQNNNNQFLWGKWPASEFSDQEYLLKYPRSRELERGTDIMFRVERNFRFSRFNVALGALPIIRLNQDEFTNPAGEREKIKGSTGATATLLASAGYSFNVRSGIKFLYGYKVLSREMHSNPDGLSRLNVITMGYIYRF